MEEQKHDVKIDVKMGNGKIYLHLDEQKFELSPKEARNLVLSVKKILNLVHRIKHDRTE